MEVKQLLGKIKQLEYELSKIKSSKKYGLIWEDKKEIFEEKAMNSLPILKEDENLRIGDNENLPDHMIIEGDNYHSLSTLLYTHKGKIDVIYIDPPYNTGNNDFIYNDNYVDKEDSYRHSKWLSFINKRLRLAKQLLSDNGVIFISIDDNEFAQLKLLCDEIFGSNLTDVMIWRKAEGKLKNTSTFRKEHEYLIVCFKNQKRFNKVLLGMKEKLSKDSFNLKVNIGKENSGYFYTIKNENYSWDGYWKYPEKEMHEMILRGEVIFKNGNVPRGKPIEQEVLVDSILDYGSSSEGKRDLGKIFGENFINEFNITPKPIQLISLLNKLSTNKNSIILDFFAGSGTTGHAVLELNKEDNGNRQFILCSNRENTIENPDKNICRDITYERNKRIINGYTNQNGEEVKGFGGNLRYYTTEFIKTDKSIDDLRYSFINMCDDLLCIKENTFYEVKLKDAVEELKLFKSKDKYTVILYNIQFFDELLKLVEVLDKPISVYIFSLNKDIFEEELIDFKNVTVQNIPDDILETYNKIFNF